MTGESVILEMSNPVPEFEAADNSKIIANRKGEEVRLCPLCHSEVRLFFINFNEKILMCENTECEFPFGHEELQFVKEDDDEASDEEDVSIRSKTSTSLSASGSVVSGAAWSEIDKINRAYESEDSQFEVRSIEPKETTSNKEINQKKKENDEKIQKNIEDIKELNEELLLEQIPAKTDRRIKNEKWIKNLKNLQQISGVQLLQPEEIGLLKKEEPVLGLGELKIDIAPATNSNMSTIKIQIHSKGGEGTGDIEHNNQ